MASRSTACGMRSTRDELSTIHFLFDDSRESCVASPASSSDDAGAVEIHAVEVRVVRVLGRLAPDGGEVQDALHRIDVDDPLGAPRARGQRALQVTRVVVQIVVSPARALRPPDEIAARLHVADVLPLARVVVDVFVQQLRRRLRRQRDVEQLEVALRAVASHEAQVVGGAVPVQIEQLLVLPLLDADPRELRVAHVPRPQLLLADLRSRPASRTCTPSAPDADWRDC